MCYYFLVNCYQSIKVQQISTLTNRLNEVFSKWEFPVSKRKSKIMFRLFFKTSQNIKVIFQNFFFLLFFLFFNPLIVSRGRLKRFNAPATRNTVPWIDRRKSPVTYFIQIKPGVPSRTSPSNNTSLPSYACA